jgi:hypothetical protein
MKYLGVGIWGKRHNSAHINAVPVPHMVGWGEMLGPGEKVIQSGENTAGPHLGHMQGRVEG